MYEFFQHIVKSMKIHALYPDARSFFFAICIKISVKSMESL